MESFSLDAIVQDIYSQISKTTVEKTVRKIYDPFDTPDQDEPIEYYTPESKSEISSRIVCLNCNVEMIKSFYEGAYECELCGQIKEKICDESYNDPQELVTGSSDINSSYNTSETSSAPICMVGPDVFKYQRNFVGTASDYSKSQKKITISQMIKIVCHYEGDKIPKNIVLEAAELYCSVQKHCIKRGDPRKGAMAACLYRVCKAYGITKKPKEIAKIFGIEQAELSSGEKMLAELISSEAISIKMNNKEEISLSPDEQLAMGFMKEYFIKLNIPEDNLTLLQPENRPNYKLFSLKLFRFTNEYNIATNSIISTKCAGLLFILAISRPELKINREKIEECCDISRATYNRFVKAVHQMLITEEPMFAKVKSRLRNLFKKFQMTIELNKKIIELKDD